MSWPFEPNQSHKFSRTIGYYLLYTDFLDRLVDLLVLTSPVALTTQAATEQLLRALSGLVRGIRVTSVNLSSIIDTGTNSSLEILDNRGSSYKTVCNRKREI